MSDPEKRGRWLAILCIVGANVFGGAAYPAQKAALEGLPPATVTFLRNLVALIVLIVVARRPGVRPPWSAAEARRAGVIGIFAFALPMWFGVIGVKHSSAANASILILLEPVTIVAIAWLLQGERIGPRKLAGLVLGLSGALAIVLEDVQPGGWLGGEHLYGNAILALHGILWGCHTPLAKPLSERHDPISLCLRVMGVGTLFLAVPAALEAGEWQAGPTLVPALLWTLALGLFVSFGSTVLWIAALRRIPSTSVAGFVFLQPFTGVLMGFALYGEGLSAAARVGAALIAAGVALDVLATARPREPRPEAS